MGIKRLNQLLRKCDKNIFQNIKMQDLKGMTLAIDTSHFMYSYMYYAISDKINKEDNIEIKIKREDVILLWFEHFQKLINRFKKYNIIAIFVIDGVPPIEKTRITNERKNKYDLLDNKINEIFKENKTYSNKIITMSSLRDIIKYPYSIIISNMKDIEDVLNQEEMEELKNILNKRDELAKNLKQNLRMSKQEKKMLYDYLEKNSDLVIYAEGEAEKECAVLVNNKIASAVITRDTDILAYGCPLVIQSLIIFDNEIDCYIENSDIINDKLVAVSYENILNKLQLNKEEFLDLCILAGTDYNINIEGIGITNAYKLIKKYKNIENIIKYLKTLIKYKDYDFLSLNYLIVRKLFCFLHTI